MNFLTILSGKKTSPADIAAEVKVLQSKAAELESSRATLEREKISLAKLRLGSGKFDAVRLSVIDKEMADVRVDFLAAQEAISELKAKLVEAVQEELDAEKRKLEQEEALIKQERSDLIEKMKSLFIQIKKLQFRIDPKTSVDAPVGLEMTPELKQSVREVLSGVVLEETIQGRLKALARSWAAIPADAEQICQKLLA